MILFMISKRHPDSPINNQADEDKTAHLPITNLSYNHIDTDCIFFIYNFIKNSIVILVKLILFIKK